MFQCEFGHGQLVTLDRVAGKALKQEAAARFGATVVDMEAAGVAAAAAECSRKFAAIKAVSDGAEEDLGFLSAFITPEGFETGRFVAHIALRPGLWPRVAALNRNSRLASTALASSVDECITDWRGFSAKHSPSATKVRLEERTWQ
jgi:adenosylhomocysteine nucleosidase